MFFHSLLKPSSCFTYVYFTTTAGYTVNKTLYLYQWMRVLLQEFKTENNNPALRDLTTTVQMEGHNANQKYCLEQEDTGTIVMKSLITMGGFYSKVVK